MMTEAALASAVRAAGIDVPILHEEVTASANQTALRLAEQGAPEWTIVTAGHQTAGRGRLGRGWVDRPGRALMFSVVLRPSLEPALVSLLSLLAGASMAQAAREVGAGDAACKWPNDLLLAGRKVGGILAEARSSGDRIEHVVVGIGVNLGEPPEGVPGAGALGDVDGPRLLERFLGRFRAGYGPGRTGFAASVLDAYRPLCSTLGRAVRARTTGGEEIEGRAIDLEPSGGLLLEVEGTRRAVTFGEIEHLDAP